ncbi:RpbA RNA polymerase binding protein [Aeromonas phage Aeh1]|uniref:RpbA RNA polymerase binding protein n=1 Tax=Aeromonas phage Aeh1 TaxID=2880362 RepID=Q76Z69_9CAUD|nr:transcriptional regulator [Aeromonas phage Aeh1]AAQ17677.1 RpbA RNA polymerase binding protein [Aeromonas phage Aeh1]
MIDFIPGDSLKTLSAAYFYQNLARKNWVCLMTQEEYDRLQCLERDVRFDVYKEFDDDVIETAIRLSQKFRAENLNCKREFVEFFPDAAILVYSEWKAA